MSTLVTGANGFLGKQLCNYLDSKKVPYFPLVRKPLISTERAWPSKNDPLLWKEVFYGIDSVVHLAAKAHDMSNPPPEIYFKINTDLTVKLAEESKRNGVKKFIFISSIKVNGESTDSTPFSSLSEPNPQDAYAQSKYMAEKQLLRLHEPEKFEVIIIRPPLIYGPHTKANFRSLIKLVKFNIPLPLGAIKNKRSLVSTYNLSDLIICCLQPSIKGGEILLVSDDQDISLTELLRQIALAYNKRSTLIPLPQIFLEKLLTIIGMQPLQNRLLSNLQVNINKTKELLNWTPPYSLATSLSMMTKAERDDSKKIFRIITTSDAVLFHLQNTLKLDHNNRITVLGDNVGYLKKLFPHIEFINIKIRRQINLVSDLIALITLTYLFLRHRPDIVHSIMPKSGLLTAIAGYLARVPIRIHTFTGQTWAQLPQGNKRSFFKYLDKFIVHLNTITLTDSPSQSNFLYSESIKKNDIPLPVLGKGSLSGVDMERFNPANISPNRLETRMSLDIKAENIVFIFLGRKCEDKGLIELINSFKLLSIDNPLVKLLLVGPNEASSTVLKNLLTTPHTSIISLPQTNTPEIYLNASDVFIIPSHREGFGTTVIEAGALGLPSIGTKIPGLIDSIQDGQTGILVSLKKENDLYEAMKLLSSDPLLRTTLAQNAQKYVQRCYDSKYVHKNLLTLYAKLSYLSANK